jgi:nucleoid-associated protein YgaU
MALVKAQIKPEGGAAIPVLFNPTQYQLNHSSEFTAKAVPGLAAPIPQYTRGQPRTLSMELFFDTYEAGTDVTDHTKLIYGLVQPRGTLHRPPECDFVWGKFTVRCLVKSVNGTFNLFLADGTPVRARLSVSLEEVVPISQQARGEPTESADHVKVYVVQRGDTLARIAAAEYGDPAKWRPIADANGIADPMSIVPGQKLALPAL